ncbi:MAG TPA: hypothetical protein VM891_11875, partial [Amaricoccus sp.]|nr:hypothetical protein [Amaricoccus sp.]
AQGTAEGTLGGRLAALESGGPFGEVSAQLAALHGQKDAAVAAVLARLGPLEERVAALAAIDPEAAAERFAERLEAARAGLQARIDALPMAALAEQLAALQARRDGIEALARLEPLETRLAGLADELRARDPQPALAGIEARLGALEGANPFAEVSEQLTRLYGQKDAGIAAMLARLAPVEAQLAAVEARLGEPQALLDRFAERLEAVQGRVALLEGAENPFGEIAEQLTKLYGQKDAGIEAMLARLQPLEAKLAALEAGDGRALLDRFAERLEAVKGRVALLEGAETPFGEIAEQLTRLYGQKDAAVEAVLARLQPLEAKLAGLEGGLARVLPLAEDDPRAAVDGLRARLEALNWAQGEVAAGLAALRAGEGGLAGIAEQLTRLHAQKDAGIAAVLERLAPLEARIAELEARPWDPDGEARAETQAITAQLLAVRVAAKQTAGLAERLARLEAGAAPAAAAAAPGTRVPTAEEIEAIWTLPRVVSLHQK